MKFKCSCPAYGTRYRSARETYCNTNGGMFFCVCASLTFNLFQAMMCSITIQSCNFLVMQGICSQLWWGAPYLASDGCGCGDETWWGMVVTVMATWSMFSSIKGRSMLRQCAPCSILIQKLHEVLMVFGDKAHTIPAHCIQLNRTLFNLWRNFRFSLLFLHLGDTDFCLSSAAISLWWSQSGMKSAHSSHIRWDEFRPCWAFQASHHHGDWISFLGIEVLAWNPWSCSAFWGQR